MNKDLTSDIKQAERFMFDNSIYLLNMFEKKIDSFINTKTKKQKQKELSFNRQQNNRIDPNTFFDDPIKNLSRDLTKPVWNCVVKVDPVVFLDNGDWWTGSQQQHSQGMSEDASLSGMSPYRHLYNLLIKHFAHRYKTQHEDESNLKINTFYCDRHSNLTTSINIDQKQVTQSQRPLTYELFGLLMRCIEKENEFLESFNDLGEVEENYKYLRQTLEAYSEVIAGYMEGSEMADEGLPLQNKELDWFLTISMHSIISMLDSRNGSTLLLIQPHIGLTTLLIHPLLISIHNVLSIQFKYNQKDKHQKDQNHHKHHSPINHLNNNNNPKELMQVEDEKKKLVAQEEEKEGAEGESTSRNDVVFEDLKYNNCSRVAFINLDGYQSEYNLDVVKYLSRNLMYVSFPKESCNRLQSNPLKQFQLQKSQRLLRKFFYQSLTEQQKRQLLKLHAIQQRDFKKNMFILPIHSRALNEKYELLYDTNGVENNGIEFYESSFVKFMMEEVVMSHLREYNPSVVVLSYSGKVTVDTDYFVELIKQLTIVSNFRLLFYPNQGKMFCFDEKGPEIVVGEDFFNEQHRYYDQYERAKINIFHQKTSGLNQSDRLNLSDKMQDLSMNTMNLDFLDKLSIFLKVSSGTHTLSRAIEEDSYIEKYKNYKIMRYSALLLKNIAKEYPTIEKLKMRANEYLTISKVLKNQYTNKSQTFDKLFQKIVTKYHDNLIKAIQKLVFLDKAIIQKPQTYTPPFNQEQTFVINSAKELLLSLNSRYEYMSKKEIWEDFKFQYKLELSTEKTENRFYLHIPRLKDRSTIQSTKNIEDLIAAVEFEIIDQKQKIPVQLTCNSKLLYTKKRLNKEALVFIINHIPKQKAFNYFSFVGVLNESIDQKSELKIQLKPVVFQKERKMSQFQHYVDFNFYQTQKFVFMFWPKIFDDVADKLARVLGEKYIPQSTLQIFRASRCQPDKFTQLSIANPETYNLITPRSGCTCYQPFQNINRLYIFGGFYNKEENYLNFQTDVSFIDFLDESNEVRVENLPKCFFVLGDETNAEESGKEEGESSGVFVKQFRNDFIRPRIEFEVYQPEKQLVEGKKEVFLIGGVGEKFMRPYSLISYTGSKLTFQQDSTISSIRRIRTNNLLPVNLSNPTKCRSPQEMNIVTNAQNRNIYINEGMITQESLVMSHYRYFYDHNQERFDYQQVYEFADVEKRNYREETQCLRKAPTQYPMKYDLMASSFRGKEFYNNFIKVSSENGKKYIFELMLELSIEVKTTYQNYQKIVRLTGASILAIDINASMLYCLIRHPSYTLDKCILAHYDINDLSGKLIDTKSVEIHLKEIHKFDCEVSKNIIIVLNSNTVAVLHGYRFNQEIEIPEMILKKYKKNQIKTLTVKPSLQESTLLSKQQLNSHIINEISSSFFINNQGVVLCLTFKSLQRTKPTSQENNTPTNPGLIQKVYMRVQRLDMTKEEYRWKMVNEKIYKFKIRSNGSGGNGKGEKVDEGLSLEFQEGLPQEGLIGGKNNYIRLIQIKPNKESKEKKEKEFFIKATYNEEIYTTTLNVDSIADTLQFIPLNQSQQQYYKSIYKDNIKQQSIYLEKNPYFYQEVKEITEFNYESLRNIEAKMDKMDLEESWSA